MNTISLLINNPTNTNKYLILNEASNPQRLFFYLVCEAIVPASGDSEDDCGEADGM
jgi:hypothetical protein